MTPVKLLMTSAGSYHKSRAYVPYGTSPRIFRYEPAKCPYATAKGVSNRLRFIALDRRVVTLPAAAHPAPPGLTVASSGDTAHGGQNVRKN